MNANEESKGDGQITRAGSWTEVSGLTGIDEEDTNGASILSNDISLCINLKAEAQSFLKKKKVEFKQNPVVNIDDVRKVERTDIAKFK